MTESCNIRKSQERINALNNVVVSAEFCHVRNEETTAQANASGTNILPKESFI